MSLEKVVSQRRRSLPVGSQGLSGQKGHQARPGQFLAANRLMLKHQGHERESRFTRHLPLLQFYYFTGFILIPIMML